LEQRKVKGEEEGKRVAERDGAVTVCKKRIDGQKRREERRKDGNEPASCSASSLTRRAEFVGLVPLPPSPAS
jgi:hypothetical protein